ncbi:response regulator transcription factor [Ideonella sp.]|uniref:helix-turn-helix transcriptional regulator n=1 Tax=Ideonella sp. TaxID=1929293 RepID=UPI0035B394DC
MSSTPDLGDAFLRGAEAAQSIASPQQFFVWLRLHLHRFVPHDLALCWARAPGAGEPRVQVLNCVPLAPAVQQGLDDPSSAWWPQAADQWGQADERACEVAPPPALRAAGFGPACWHGVRWAPAARPQLAFAFFRQSAGDAAAVAASLAALDLWMPYLHFAWWRAEGGAVRPAGARAEGRASTLTAREIEVLSAVREAKANAQIGAQLGISPLTVKNHLRSIQRKLGARNRAHAVAEAMARRLIS